MDIREYRKFLETADLVSHVKLPTQLHTGKRPLKGRFQQPLNYGKWPSGFHKPVGGMWTSTYETAFDVGWPSWVLDEEFHVEQLEQAWLLEPRKARVIELLDFPMCHEFMRRYAHDYSGAAACMRERFGASWLWSLEGYEDVDFGGASLMCPEWERVAEDADAVRLLTPYGMDIRFGPYLTFNGWDCESTIWLDWCFAGPARRVDLSPQIDAKRLARVG